VGQVARSQERLPGLQESERRMIDDIIRCEDIKLTDGQLRQTIKLAGRNSVYGTICAELLARREADRWIPVSEKLPEKYDDVLVCSNEYTDCVEAHMTGNHWFTPGSELLTDVYCWREKPEPPEVQP